MKSMGGDLGLEHTLLGQETTFLLERRPSSKRAPASERPAQKPMKDILVVEDAKN